VEFQRKIDQTSLDVYAAQVPGAALLPAVKAENSALEADLSAAITAVEKSLDTPDLDTGDLRRQQLSMRAAEQQKAADKKEESKKRKAEEKKTEPKAKGRPRKQFLAETSNAQGDASPSAPTAPASPAKRRRGHGKRREEGASTAPPEAAALPSGESSAARPKAAAKVAAKSQPTAKAQSRRRQAGQQEEVSVNEADKLEMQAILLRLQGAKYDKQAETLHKGKFEGVQISVYWTRCAVGVKIWDAASRKWKQVQYFSEEPLCLRICQASNFAAELEKHLPEIPDWAETAEGIRFVRVLRVTAAAALAAHHRV
jgi:hypothetical protein